MERSLRRHLALTTLADFLSCRLIGVTNRSGHLIAWGRVPHSCPTDGQFLWEGSTKISTIRTSGSTTMSWFFELGKLRFMAIQKRFSSRQTSTRQLQLVT